MIPRFSTILFVAIFGLNNLASGLSFSDNDSDEKIALTNSDKKKLEKADKEAQKSKDLMQEADKQYADIASKQASMTAEETEKLNNKALAKQIDALKVLKSANKMKFEVYSDKADEFWKKFKGNPDNMSYAKSLESNARISYQSSQEQYKTAEGIDDKLISYSNMTSASDLSNKSVDDIKKAFDIYSSTSLTGTSAFQPVIEQKAPDTIAPKTSTTLKAETIVTPVKDTSSTNTFTAVKDTSKVKVPKEQTSLPFDNKEEVMKKLNEKIKNNSETTPGTGQVNTEVPAVQNYSQEKRIKRSSEDYVQKSTVATGEGFTYKVQIAASRVPMTNELLKNIYSGPEQPEQSYSGEWYKYTIGSFSSSASAMQLRESCQVRDAFVVAVFKGKNIIFKVQVAACRNEMPTEELRKFYDKTEELESSQEDGWYKYLVNCGDNFGKACELLKNMRLSGAFIAAYRDGQRIELKEIFTE
jgi:hypothetical protein